MSATVSDTKTLQDFAEKCSRSGNTQLHLLLISHKEISNYIDKLPKEKTDGWRGLSERFKHFHLGNNFNQTYEIIPAVIKHNYPDWGNFCTKYKKNFAAIIDRYTPNPMFKDYSGNMRKMILGSFPLHPVSVFILPRLSEMVAQNERTLFTFLSAEGRSTLQDFLNSYQNDFSWVTPDIIFDYFEPLIKKEFFDGTIYNIYNLTSKILCSIEKDFLAAKIIKTLYLIYILEQFNQLPPTKEQVLDIFSSAYEPAEIERAIDFLIEKNFVIYIKRSNNYLKLKQASGVDVRQKIQDLTETLSGKISPKDIFNAANFDKYIYPSRYNDFHCMTRFFSFHFLSGSEIFPEMDWNIKIEKISADGVICAIIPKSAEQLQTLRQTVLTFKKNSDRIIFVLPKKFSPADKIALEYAAVSKLREAAGNDEDTVLFEEYEIILEDLQEILKNFIGAYTQPEKFETEYICDGKILNLSRKSQLTELLSKICDRVYSLTPVINNETVNKNEITGTAQKNRDKVVAALLRIELEKNLGFVGSRQEVSIMRSTLIRTEILSEESGQLRINLSPADSKFSNLLGTIEQFILSAQAPLSFAQLYEKLTSPLYHIGLRRGVIPIYLAAVLHKYLKQIIIKNGVSAAPINANTLHLINCKPEVFTLEYLEWNEQKENYIKALTETFKDYILEVEREYFSFDYLANALKRWYYSLPKFSKTCTAHPNGEKFSKPQIKIINALNFGAADTELILKKLPAVVQKNFLPTRRRKLLQLKNFLTGY